MPANRASAATAAAATRGMRPLCPIGQASASARSATDAEDRGIPVRASGSVARARGDEVMAALQALPIDAHLEALRLARGDLVAVEHHVHALESRRLRPDPGRERMPHAP